MSHIHADHVGGLEHVAFCCYFNPLRRRPKLFLHADLADRVWDSFKWGLDSIEGVQVTLDTFFDVIPVTAGFNWEEYSFELVRTHHVYNNNALAPSYGLNYLNQHTNQRVFFATDTVIRPEFNQIYDVADVIVHDCETAAHKSGVHARYEDLNALSRKVKGKMWLSHYQPNPPQDAVADGFLGFATKGQVVTP